MSINSKGSNSCNNDHILAIILLSKINTLNIAFQNHACMHATCGSVNGYISVHHVNTNHLLLLTGLSIINYHSYM